jgi:hypothetical protein
MMSAAPCNHGGAFSPVFIAASKHPDGKEDDQDADDNDIRTRLATFKRQLPHATGLPSLLLLLADFYLLLLLLSSTTD